MGRLPPVKKVALGRTRGPEKRRLAPSSHWMEGFLLAVSGGGFCWSANAAIAEKMDEVGRSSAQILRCKRWPAVDAGSY